MSVIFKKKKIISISRVYKKINNPFLRYFYAHAIKKAFQMQTRIRLMTAHNIQNALNKTVQMHATTELQSSCIKVTKRKCDNQWKKEKIIIQESFLIAI